ncbi:hypothetical protein FRB96_008270 [Tulasnella sp. 330]|nr:hypothetical protein FRB96_008270 [Tulasnella sp. 330]
MPRKWSNPSVYYHILKLSLGSRAATQELAWIKQALSVDMPPAKDYDALLASMVRRRANGEPLAYVIGNQPFGSLSVKCRPPTLIPRPETEHWTMKLLEILHASRWHSKTHVLDICTGTGCIPLLLAKASPNGHLNAVGVDISALAINLARGNVNDVLRDGHNSVSIVKGDLFSTSFADDIYRQLSQPRAPFDVITCNPPYIPQHEYDRLSPSVRDYEDPVALLGDHAGQPSDGLSFYQRLVEILHSTSSPLGKNSILTEGGMLVVEHGDGQSQAVQEIFKTGFGRKLSRMEAWKDQWNKHRAVMAVL